jgi:hypothetical protein
VAIVVMIAFSALIAGYEAVQRLFNPQPIGHLWAVVAAAIIAPITSAAPASAAAARARSIGSILRRASRRFATEIRFLPIISGVALARFAELHGGAAWVEDRPGGGTVFSVHLPGEVSFPVAEGRRPAPEPVRR